jgi:hypothetical protein
MRLKTLSYTGNGADDRSITGAGFQPTVVITKQEVSRSALWTTDQHADDTEYFRGLGGGSNKIQQLEADGFQVGTGVEANEDTKVYHAICFLDDGSNARMAIGQYTGDGNDDRGITGVGFQPDYVWIKSLGADQPVQTHSLDGDDSHVFYSGAADFANAIQSLDADGFTVGTDATVNTDTVVYTYVAFTEVSNNTDVLTYTGNGADDRSITGVGFLPEYVKVKSDGAATHQGVHRSDTLSGDLTLFYQSQASVADYIQALEADGIQVGTKSIVNQNTVVYHLMSWKNLAASAGFAHNQVIMVG